MTNYVLSIINVRRIETSDWFISRYLCMSRKVHKIKFKRASCNVCFKDWNDVNCIYTIEGQHLRELVLNHDVFPV